MREVPLERDSTIAINGAFWVEVANPEHPFTAILTSRSRGTCLIHLIQCRKENQNFCCSALLHEHLLEEGKEELWEVAWRNEQNCPDFNVSFAKVQGIQPKQPQASKVSQINGQ